MLPKNKWPAFNNRNQYRDLPPKELKTNVCFPSLGICFAVSTRKWSQGKRKSVHGGYQGPIECLPELMAACEGKENVFASIVDSELQTAHISQVILSIRGRYQWDWKGRVVGKRNSLFTSLQRVSCDVLYKAQHIHCSNFRVLLVLQGFFSACFLNIAFIYSLLTSNRGWFMADISTSLCSKDASLGRSIC